MGLFDEKLMTDEELTGEIKLPEISEIAVISSCTKIEGNIKTEGHLIVNGEVQGSVSARGNLILSGVTAGEIYCESILFETTESNSDIIAEQNVVIKEGTTVRGNIHCKNITIMGSVYGDITASGTIILKSTAVVTGNVIAKRIGVENGAKINGSIEMK